MPDLNLTWYDFTKVCAELVTRNPQTQMLWGIPTGGSLVALECRRIFRETNPGIVLLDHPRPGCLIVDDIVDSGRTLQRLWDDDEADTGSAEYSYDVLFHKQHSPEEMKFGRLVDGWVRFPWEHETGAEDAVVRLLELIGEDPTRDGLRDTPARVCKALKEMTSGTSQDPKEILARTFEIAHDQMIVLSGIRFTSLCEHHLLPFVGTAAVGYIPYADPGGTKNTPRVVGISKLARLVKCFAKRLQVQERLTDQIAEALQLHLHPLGVGVIMKAHHSCMGCRGIEDPDAELVTSRLLGRMNAPEVRGEFLRLAGY